MSMTTVLSIGTKARTSGLLESPTTTTTALTLVIPSPKAATPRSRQYSIAVVPTMSRSLCDRVGSFSPALLSLALRPFLMLLYVLPLVFFLFACLTDLIKHFVKNAFSVPGAHKLDHFIYDTNCDAKQQVMKEPRDTWWDVVGMCVDVWHFLNKHKVSHEFCQKYCNCYDYPELLNENGKTWFFNTSIAEQVNVWLGGYHAFVRKMLPVKYNFFLDEMIRLRNIATIAQLERDGHHPHHAPLPETS